MEIRQDPEGNEVRSLLNLVSLERKTVLEIGCGDGRLTWRYASEPAHIVAIEPFEPSFKQARANLPGSIKDRVELFNVGLEDFAAASEAATFDVVILSWSLC